MNCKMCAVYIESNILLKQQLKELNAKLMEAHRLLAQYEYAEMKRLDAEDWKNAIC